MHDKSKQSLKLYIYKILFSLLAVALIVSCGVQEKIVKDKQENQAKSLASTKVSDQVNALYSQNSSNPSKNIPDSSKTSALIGSDSIVKNTPKLAESPDSVQSSEVLEAHQDSMTLSLLDSLKAKYSDNGTGIQWNDSVAAAEDSIQKSKKSSMLEAPVEYEASDSIIFIMDTKKAYLYGNGDVKYQNIELTSEQIVMNVDSSIVDATGVADSLGVLKGTPVFKQGSDSYESETMKYNFKTKKGYITNVYTEQQDGFLTSEEAKKSGDNELYLKHGRYTTCDEEHPHFYIALSNAKVHTGKDIFAGPAWIVVEDVPLPLAIPFAYFPFTKSYSSGFIMPSYGDESTRGFYLRDGGYYFAFSDYMDLKLTGEIYTKGSWGIGAQTSYKKRYKYNGRFYINYQVTKNGEKNLPDYSASKNFKIQWQHSLDSKAGNNTSFSAMVNFATQSYERNNLTSLYNPAALSQSTRTSSISYSKSFPKIGLSISSSFNIAQNMKDSTISLTLPTLSVSLSRLYPFKRKHAVGKERWYEKIALSYTGTLSNSISTKESKLFKSSLSRDWRNGMNHSIPISASFNVLKFINVTPQINYTARWYTHRVEQRWDEKSRTVVRDTIDGFYHVQDFNMGVSANTKLYGFYVPSKKIFGDKVEKIRHVLTPSISLTYAPDFSTDFWGYYKKYTRTDDSGRPYEVQYSPFDGSMYGVPSSRKRGDVHFDIDNNVEMKYKDKNDSIRKISIIDQLGASLSYNMAAKNKPWSNLSTRLRLKFGKTTFSINALFNTYAYEFNDNGQVIEGTRTEWSYGRFGRFQGMSKNVSYTFNNQSWRKIKNSIMKLLGRDVEEDELNGKKHKDDDYDDYDDTDVDDSDLESNMDKRGKEKKTTGALDEDGYMSFKLPWSFSISYGISMVEDRGAQINVKTMRYPYKFTQNMNFSGNMKLSSSWNVSFSSGWDFNYKKLSMTTVNISRDMHCFNISCGLAFGTFTSYNITLRANASTLTDALKYDKKSSYNSSIRWY